jgi:hypothetical protein
MRFALIALLLCGCPGSRTPSDHPAPTAADIVDKLAKAREAMTSFVADATMDYWLDNQRMKGEVLVMGSVGAKVRFAALSPAGGSTLAELACDGKDFVLVDYQKNCQRSGPCNAQTIAQFFHIAMEPDDFLHLALGTPPVIANANGKVTWDSSRGVEKVELTGPDGTEKLSIDDNHGHFDVVDAELSVGGKTKWSVANTDFTEVAGHRVPGKSRFKSPAGSQDLLVEWGQPSSRKVNEPQPDDKFKLAPPPGLAACN